MSHSIRRAEASEQARVAAVLADAFSEDPIIQWILPDARNTETARLGLFDQAAHMYLRDGIVEATSGFEATALWGVPDPPPRAFFGRIFDDLRALFSTTRAAGSALGRAIQLYQTMGNHRPEEPHWYLSAIGTRATARGQGAASTLLAKRLAHCDSEGTLAYLESSNVVNLPLYQRHGFVVIEEIHVADSPPLWTMRREPGESPSEASFR